MKPNSDHRGDITPVTGGIPLPAHLVDSFASDEPLPTDKLGREISLLLHLHQKALPLQYRNSQIAAMDEATKQSLLTDIRRRLGIAPFLRDTLYALRCLAML